MNNNDTWKMGHETWELAFVTLLGLIGTLVGLYSAENRADEVRKEAVLVGAAQYISNEKGISRFEWNKK